MGKFSVTHKAKTDLKSIAAYMQRKWRIKQRAVYVKQFDDTFRNLANNPDAGQVCDFIEVGYRKFPCSSHVIFYRLVSNNDIQIVRIIHKRMDVKSKLDGT
uniref:type II toxin-antitoxin system RelE/ParE family toxin n=1 Tax=Ningiella ruwaisensis TaxID=2364274 RepID=UPI00109F41DB|nr:type II toxin-antitoxin system RelE/ParE family toxin [Ningiella ruwaisensis]